MLGLKIEAGAVLGAYYYFKFIFGMCGLGYFLIV